MDEPTTPPPGQARGPDGKWIYTAEGAERDARALELRTKGWSYRRIADHLGHDVHVIYDGVQRSLQAIVQEPAEQVRTLELDRLDQMHAAAMEVLEREHVTVSHGEVVTFDGRPLPDDAPVLQAIDRLLRIQERRAKLLGLDAATKTNISGGVKYEIVGVNPEDLK